MNSIRYFHKDKKQIKYEEIKNFNVFLQRILNEYKSEKPYGTEYVGFYNGADLIACLVKDDRLPLFNITSIKNNRPLVRELIKYYPNSQLEILLNLKTLEDVTDFPCNPIKLKSINNIIFENKSINVPSSFYEQEEIYLHSDITNYLEIKHFNCDTPCDYISKHSLSSVLNYCFTVSNDRKYNDGSIEFCDMALFAHFDGEFVKSFEQHEEVNAFLVVTDLILPVTTLVNKYTKEIIYFYTTQVSSEFSKQFDIHSHDKYEAKLLLIDKIFNVKFAFQRHTGYISGNLSDRY